MKSVNSFVGHPVYGNYYDLWRDFNPKMIKLLIEKEMIYSKDLLAMGHIEDLSLQPNICVE